MSETIIETDRLSKEFVRDEFRVVALKDVTLSIDKGEFVVLMGPSGSGKSTLLHLIAAMDRPSSGTMRVLGHSLGDMTDSQIAHWRNENIGFIFQQFNLIPVLTAFENVELPLLLTPLKKAERRDHVDGICPLTIHNVYPQCGSDTRFANRMYPCAPSIASRYDCRHPCDSSGSIN